MKSIPKYNLFLSIYLVLPSAQFVCEPNPKRKDQFWFGLKEGDGFPANKTGIEAKDYKEMKNTQRLLPQTNVKDNHDIEGHKIMNSKDFNIDFNASGIAVTPTSEIKPEATSKHSDVPTHVTQIQSDSGTVAVPKYAFYIIGLVMILLLAATIILGVLLYQNKFNEYQVFTTQAAPSGPINVDVARKYITQTSQEMTLLNISTDNKNETSPKTEDTNEIPTNKMPQSPMKIYKSVRKPVDHQMLLREQMKKICDDALAKSQNTGIAASLKDLSTLLQEFDADKHEKSQESTTREKSASYPQLDVYDEPPARKKPVTGEEVDIPVYDCLPPSNNIVVQDYDSNYLLTLSKENCSDIEPSYINAKYVFK